MNRSIFRWSARSAAVLAAAVLAAALLLALPTRRDMPSSPAGTTPAQVSLIDITSADIPRDRGFYEHSFGWTLKADYPNYPIMAAGAGPDIGIAMLGNPEAGPLEPLYRIGKYIVFFGVWDIPATLRRAEALGGKVTQPQTPIEVGGTFAMITDPVGNTIGLTEPAGTAPMPPTASTPEPATLVAISTPDVPATRAFYEQLFGLRLKEESPGYPILTSGAGPDIGIARADDPAAGPAEKLYRVGQPVVLLQTPDIAATLATIGRNGGSTFQSEVSLPSGGAYAFFTDPSGNTLGLLERH
ncbi:VOC family protein [Nocardia sp. 2]|uniref:VOC family protein n=1 Tax=Nocardia acididurans TaxID=2802282 RepID=A0ABS1MG25_9NOCA|nr:VOC family protein [Nocardia acididurans]MBL1079617.1 VOC family protein [Nocardia acididurans]